MLETAVPVGEAVAEPSRRGFRRIAIVTIVAALAIAVVSAVSFKDWFGGPAGGPIESLAVLPLENLSGDEDQEYFADGHDRCPDHGTGEDSPLKVISRTSVMQFKGTRQALPAIGRALQVDAIVAGSVRRSGQRVAISVQLIRASTDLRGTPGRRPRVAPQRGACDRGPGPRNSLADLYERQGLHDEAFAEFVRAKEHEGAGPEILELYREAYQRGGTGAYRELELKRFIESWNGGHLIAYVIGERAGRLDHVDVAFDWLDRVVEARSGMVVWLPTAPGYEKLRTHPRYQRVLQRIDALPKETGH